LPSLAYDLDQHALPAPPVEFPVKDLFPRPKVQATISDCHHHLAAHHLPLQVRVGVVPSASFGTGLAGAVVPVLVYGRVRRQPFEPRLVIVVQAALVVVCQKNTIAG